MTVPVVDQELVVHVFSPIEGLLAAAAYEQVRRLWSACRGQLGMTEPIPGMAVGTLLPQAYGDLRADGPVAVQERPDGSRQAVLRRVHDVTNLSVALAQLEPEGRSMGWAEWAQIWSQASGPSAGAALGEARLYLARAPAAGGAGTVAATAELGRSLEPFLPYREDRVRQWWRDGITTTSGYAVWDLSPGDTGSVREIVILAAEDRADELSAWAWSDGTAGVAPFVRYLLHAAKLRFEARLLDTWEQGTRGGDVNAMLAELSVALAPDAPHPGKAGLLRSRLNRLRAEEVRLSALKADLERLSTTVAIARDNLRAAGGGDAGEGAAGLFATDQVLGRWMSEQLEDDLKYLWTDLGQTRQARELAGEELEQAVRAEPAASSSGTGDAGGAAEDPRRRVFVVHGRDAALTRRFYDLLRAVDLRPLEWETLVGATGRATPSLAEVVARAPHFAQATLVLLSPDDMVELHSDLVLDSDGAHDRVRSGQARPNVLFELGLALMAYPDRTVIAEVGQMRPLSDLAGLNVIRFDGSAEAIKKVLHRLEIAGCEVDDSGVDWLDPERFSGLRAYRRGPDNHERPVS